MGRDSQKIERIHIDIEEVDRTMKEMMFPTKPYFKFVAKVFGGFVILTLSIYLANTVNDELLSFPFGMLFLLSAFLFLVAIFHSFE